MLITATELKTNMSKYLDLSQEEDIFVTRNGKTIAKISNPYQNRMLIAESLFGSISLEKSEEKLLKERINKL